MESVSGSNEGPAAFVAARLDEAEAAAWAIHDVAKCDALLYEEDMAGAAARDPDCDCGYPARVLREVAAKRAILKWWRRGDRDPAPSPTYEEWRRSLPGYQLLLHIAAIWSDHPGYRAEWGPRASAGPTVLTSGDPQPPAGTLVRDDCGTEWRHDGGGYWVREDDPGGDPESWTKIAGNYGPVTVLEYGD